MIEAVYIIVYRIGATLSVSVQKLLVQFLSMFLIYECFQLFSKHEWQ